MGRLWSDLGPIKNGRRAKKSKKPKTALALSARRDNEQKYARIESGTIMTDMKKTLFTRDIAQMLSSQICTFWSHVSPRSAAVQLTLNSPFLFFCAQYYHITEPCLLIGYKYAKTTCTFESNLPIHVQMSVIHCSAGRKILITYWTGNPNVLQ